MTSVQEGSTKSDKQVGQHSVWWQGTQGIRAAMSIVSLLRNMTTQEQVWVFRNPTGWSNAVKYSKGEIDFVPSSSQGIGILSKFQYNLKENIWGSSYSSLLFYNNLNRVSNAN